jgi:diguanylate cyclase (GGDEF)-like protein
VTLRMLVAALASAIALCGLAALAIADPPDGSVAKSDQSPGHPAALDAPNDPLEPLLPPDPTGGLDDLLPPGDQAQPEQPTSTTPAPSPSEPAKAPTRRTPRTRSSSELGGASSLRSPIRSAAQRSRPRRARHIREQVRERTRRVRHGASAQEAPTRSKPEPQRTQDSAPTEFVGRVFERIPPQYRAAVVVLACISALLAIISLRERRRSIRVQRLALVDPLTGLPNRQAFERRLAKEWKRAERYDRPLGMMLLDLDDFKEINDTQGHAAGDAVLREVAAAISGRVRAPDIAARLGGDEFVVLCCETPLGGVESLARSLEERLRQASIRTSVGFTEREPSDESPDDLVARADAAMYRRKQAMRSVRRRTRRARSPVASRRTRLNGPARARLSPRAHRKPEVGLEPTTSALQERCSTS